MKSFVNIIKNHFILYPEMKPQDAVKLIYQNCFGAEHFITDPNALLGYLEKEYEGIEKHGNSYAEDIGNGICRLYLNGINEHSLNTVNRLFISAAENTPKHTDTFYDKLSLVKSLALTGDAPFTASEFDAYCDEYLSSGCERAVHHSDAYRKKYASAYRLIDSYYMPFLPLIFEIDRLLSEKSRAIIAIDGDCASGKTTLAKRLSRIYSTSVISMDHFFLPPELRCPERLALPGANIHSERFADEVANNLRARLLPFSYRVFDCSVMDYNGSVEVAPSELIIVEGSYSHRPEFADAYDIRVLLTVPSETQLSRLALRCRDSEMLERFINQWIPFEKRYMEELGIRDLADLTFTT